MGYKKNLYDVPKVESIQKMLLNSEEKYGDKLALEDLNKTPIGKLTYSELLRTVFKSSAML
jgi:hypothetical protein